MFTTITRTLCTLALTLTITTSVNAQLSSAFGGGKARQPQPQVSGQAGQTTQASNAPHGVWYLKGDLEGTQIEIIYAFQPDSTMALGVNRTPNGGQSESQTFEGRYQMSGDQIQINYNDGDVENFRVRQNGDRLNLTSPDGSVNYDLTAVRPNQPGPIAGGGGSQGGGGSVAPQQQNPHAGHWVLSTTQNGTTIDGTMDLNADGSYKINLNVSSQAGTNQTNMNGRWRVEGNQMVFETDGEVEHLPMQFDGQRLAIDFVEFGARAIFARTAQQSGVEAIGQGN